MHSLAAAKTKRFIHILRVVSLAYVYHKYIAITLYLTQGKKGSKKGKGSKKETNKKSTKKGKKGKK